MPPLLAEGDAIPRDLAIAIGGALVLTVGALASAVAVLWKRDGKREEARAAREKEITEGIAAAKTNDGQLQVRALTELTLGMASIAGKVEKLESRNEAADAERRSNAESLREDIAGVRLAVELTNRRGAA